MNPQERVGKYRLLRLLGTGGMGVVHEAEDTVLHRRVALKILSPRGQLSELSRKRFRREAEVAASIVHPNVVAVHDAGDEAGRLFLVMELVEGTTLEVWLARKGTSPQARAAMIEKAALGVAAAHARGVVHRDLKPGNIYITPAGEPKVGDFGLAHLVDSDQSLTRTGAQIGTPIYMAPEQVRGDKAAISPATDVHALGAMLYEALSGHAPFSAPTLQQVYLRIVNEEAPPLRRANPRVSLELQFICEKALSKEPKRRYANAGELAEDLRRFREGLPVSATSPGLGYRLWKALRRRRWAWAAGLLLLAGAAAAAVTVARQKRLSEQLAKTSELSSLTALARDISDAYADSRLATFEILKRLEDRHVGERPEPDVATLLQQAREAMRSVAARHAGSRIPEAWLGLLLHFGGDPGGLPTLEAAAQTSDRDPIPHVLLARARLADYVRAAATPDYISLGVTHLGQEAFEEDAPQRGRRESCRRALARALGFPVWDHLRQGREYRIFASGIDHLGAGRFAETAADMARIADDPELGGQARYLQARALALQDRLPEAADVAERLAARKWPAAFKLAGLSWMAEGHRQYRQQGRGESEMEKALADFAAGATIDPRSEGSRRGAVVTRRFLADAKRQSGEDPEAALDAAIAEADAALQVLPTDAGILLSKASCLRIRADHRRPLGPQCLPLYDEAVRIIEGVLATFPVNLPDPEAAMPVYVNLINTLTGRALTGGDYGRDFLADMERAERLAGEAEARRPGHPELIAARARARFCFASLALRKHPLEAERRLDLCMADYDELLKRSPGEAELLAGRSQAWSLKMDFARSDAEAVRAYDRAFEDLTQALDRRPGYAFARDRRGHLSLKLSDRGSVEAGRRIAALERATEDFTRLVDRDAKNQQARALRAIVQLRMSQLVQDRARTRDLLMRSIRDGDEAVRLVPTDHRAWLNRGAAWYSLASMTEEAGERRSQFEKAAADFRQASIVNPKYLLALTQLGYAHAQLGNIEEAREAWTKALDLNPADPTLNRLLKQLPQK